MRTAAIIGGSAFPSPGFTSLWWAPGTVGGSTADATDCLARFRTLWEGVKAIMSTTVTIDYDPICIAVEATTGALTGAFAGTDPLSSTGADSGDALPRQTQALLRLATSSVVGGRRLRGRLFIPGMVETSNTSTGQVVGTTVSTLTTAGSTILAAGATASAPVIWHRPEAGAGGVSALITGVSCATTWSVLRSRR
jgi:hypothetical protein